MLLVYVESRASQNIQRSSASNITICSVQCFFLPDQLAFVRVSMWALFRRIGTLQIDWYAIIHTDAVLYVILLYMFWHASMVWRVSCGIYCTINSFNGAACCSRKFEYGIQCTWFLWKLSSLALQQMLPVLVLSWQWFEGVWRSNLSYSEATLYEIRDMEILIGNI